MSLIPSDTSLVSQVPSPVSTFSPSVSTTTTLTTTDIKVADVLREKFEHFKASIRDQVAQQFHLAKTTLDSLSLGWDIGSQATRAGGYLVIKHASAAQDKQLESAINGQDLLTKIEHIRTYTLPKLATYIPEEPVFAPIKSVFQEAQPILQELLNRATQFNNYQKELEAMLLSLNEKDEKASSPVVEEIEEKTPAPLQENVPNPVSDQPSEPTFVVEKPIPQPIVEEKATETVAAVQVQETTTTVLEEKATETPVELQSPQVHPETTAVVEEQQIVEAKQEESTPVVTTFAPPSLEPQVEEKPEETQAPIPVVLPKKRRRRRHDSEVHPE